MRRIIIKIGSSSIIDENSVFNTEALVELAEQIKNLIKWLRWYACYCGAICVEMTKLGFKAKPRNMALKQACDALGQATLMKIYEDLFSLFHL